MLFQIPLDHSPKSVTNLCDVLISNTTWVSFYTSSLSRRNKISSTCDATDKSLLEMSFEPTPFKEGAYLKALPGEDNIFVTREGPIRSENIIPLTHPATTTSLPGEPRCFHHQEDRWDEHYHELLQHKKKHGNCYIPEKYPENFALGRWARRQRYQYKQRQLNKRSSMSEERQRLLELAGFVWDPQMDVWETRRQELEEYKHIHGNCDVPSRYQGNPQLARWVKRQRRQYK